MFGLGNTRAHDVRLTEIEQLEKNMSGRELKEFRKRQKQAEKDRMWDMMMWADFMDEEG